MIAWDPEVMARLRHLQLVAVQTVDGLLHGSHRSRRVGSNIEFADYKDYTPGDNLRDLDWRVMARSDRLVVRRYEVETELASVVVFDASGDLGTGTRSPYGRPPLEGTKFGYALTLAACLAWFLYRHQEPVGLAILGGEGPGPAFIPPRSGSGHIARLLGALAGVQPGGRAELGATLARLGPRMRRRSLVLLVSDFMEEPQTWVPALDSFAQRRTDLAAFHVMDRRELTLDYERPMIFHSPEGGEDLPVDPVGAAPEFRRVLAGWLGEVRQGLVGARGRYYPAWTDLPLDMTLRAMIRGARGVSDDRLRQLGVG